jgi:hypothetical protein
MVTPDPVDSLRRLRQLAEGEAKRTFALRLAEEEAARRQMAAAEARMTRERDIATDPARGDGAVEAYIAWLPGARREAQAAQAAYERATANVTLARAELTLAHAAAEAVANFLQRRAAAAAAAAARQSQTALDEIAARPAAPAD